MKLLRWGKGAAISTRMRRDARSKGAAWAKAPHRDQDDDELVQRLAKALRIHVSVHPHGRCAGQKVFCCVDGRGDQLSATTSAFLPSASLSACSRALAGALVSRRPRSLRRYTRNRCGQVWIRFCVCVLNSADSVPFPILYVALYI